MDERYQDYACRSHIRLVQARLSYTEIFQPSCKRTDTIQQNWYLPSVFHAAEEQYPEIDDLDAAIRDGLVEFEHSASSQVLDPVEVAISDCCAASIDESYSAQERDILAIACSGDNAFPVFD